MYYENHSMHKTLALAFTKIYENAKDFFLPFSTRTENSSVIMAKRKIIFLFLRWLTKMIFLLVRVHKSASALAFPWHLKKIFELVCENAYWFFKFGCEKFWAHATAENCSFDGKSMEGGVYGKYQWWCVRYYYCLDLL